MKNEKGILASYQVKIFDEIIPVEAYSIYEAKRLASILFKKQHKDIKVFDSISISGLVAGAKVKRW